MSSEADEPKEGTVFNSFDRRGEAEAAAASDGFVSTGESFSSLWLLGVQRGGENALAKPPQVLLMSLDVKCWKCWRPGISVCLHNGNLLTGGILISGRRGVSKDW